MLRRAVTRNPQEIEASEPRSERELDELMVAYQGGDFSAFEELYRYLAPKLGPDVAGGLRRLEWALRQAIS